ncbi:hypothetical protein NKH34_12120 [Mesorhizobium sp. M1148]|uniref:hypothetical protein n=1 Tax=unclassified Mesorhizobium TaxID=325217 RepID=UPI003339F646
MMDQKCEKPAALDTRTGSEMSTSFPASDGSDHSKPARKRNGKDTPQARWNAEHPLERWAHAAVESAIRRGLMTRKPCAVCGDPKTDAHHEPGRYQEPLTSVTFLCRLHHRHEHGRLRRQQNGGA